MLAYVIGYHKRTCYCMYVVETDLFRLHYYMHMHVPLMELPRLFRNGRRCMCVIQNRALFNVLCPGFTR